MACPTKKQIAAGQRRTLAAMAKKLRDMAAAWGDVDTYCENALEDLAQQADQVSKDMTEWADE